MKPRSAINIANDLRILAHEIENMVIACPPAISTPVDEYIHPVLGELRTFPGAEGHGSDSIAGRGGRVIPVKNLNESGPDSFREAIEATGNRIIVFKVAGHIEHTSDLSIVDRHFSIYGQTAPGPISIGYPNASSNNGALLGISASEGLVQSIGLRIFAGTPAGQCCRDGLAFGDGTAASKVLFDRVSILWATDENFEAWFGSNTFTLSRSILGEPLRDSTGDSATNIAKNALIGQNSFDGNVSIIKNLFAHGLGRNPNVRLNRYDIRSNMIYNQGNWGVQIAGAGQEGNVVDNFFKSGANTPGTPAGGNIEIFNGTSAFVSGNITPGGIVNNGTLLPNEIPCPEITKCAAAAVEAWMDANVGPINRDLNDQRIVDDAINGNGQHIDCVDGLVPTSANNNCARNVQFSVPPITLSNPDLDELQIDCVPNAWKIACGGAALHGDNYDTTQFDSNGDGYTDHEDYIFQTFGF